MINKKTITIFDSKKYIYIETKYRMLQFSHIRCFFRSYFSLSRDRCIKGVNIDEIKGQLELEDSTTLVVTIVM